MNLADFLKKTTPLWKGVTETSELDVSILIAHSLGKSRPWVLSHSEVELSPDQLEILDHQLRQYHQGVPLPYLLGQWEFFGNQFFITQATLIPRPETELMVEEVIHWLAEHPEASRVLDIGTGCGCVAISIALHCPRTQVIANDLSYDALRVAKKNVEMYHLEERVLLVSASILPPLATSFDVICANLPYIPSDRLRILPIYRREPTLALDGGKDGLELYRKLFAALPSLPKKPCLITCEMDASQAAEMVAMAQRKFPAAQITVIKDLSHHDRLLRVEIETE